MAVVEVGGKYRTIDDRTLGNILGEALKGSAGDLHVGAVYALIIAHILRRSGEIHTLAFFVGPLVVSLIPQVVVLAVLLAVEVAAPNGEAQAGVAGAVQQTVQILAPSPLAALYAVVNDLMGVQVRFGMGLVDAFQIIHICLHIGIGISVARQIPVVQENGVGNPTVLCVPNPVAVGGIKVVLIGDVALIRNGIVPLDVAALVPHPLEHLFKQGHIGSIDAFFLVDEVAVEAVVVHNVDKLLGIGEVALFILVQPLFGVLGGSGNEVLAQGLDAVLMGGVDGGNGGQGHSAVFLVVGPSDNASRGTSASADKVGILPELIGIEREVVIGVVAVPGGVGHVGGAVVAGRNSVQGDAFIQIGIGLGRRKLLVALLQGHIGFQFIRIVVRCRVIIQDVHKPEAVGPGFIGCAALGLCLGSLILLRLCGKDCGGGKCRRGKRQRQEQGNCPFSIFPLHKVPPSRMFLRRFD